MKRALMVLLVLLACAGAYGQDRIGKDGYVFENTWMESTILAQEDSPIEINQYSGEYSSTERGLLHTIYYTAKDERRVAAVRFRIMSFDYFDEFMCSSNGFDRPPTTKKTWDMTQLATFKEHCRGDFEFLKGIVWVYEVRFRNGDHWKADEASVTLQVQEIMGKFENEWLVVTKGE